MMKSLLIFLLSAPLFSQTNTPTSIFAEETHPSFTPGDSLSNARLFLSYSAEKAPSIFLNDFELKLPTGQNLTYEHLPNHPATIHLKTSGDPTTQRIEVPNSLVSDHAVDFTPLPGKHFPMEGAFTLLARFSTTANDGTLASRAPRKGEWTKGGKTFFIRNGRLHYDVGCVGNASGGRNVNDRKEHLAVVTSTPDGKIKLFLDGKKIAEHHSLSSPDQENHVFKIGSTATDFAGNFTDGSISQVLFWKRTLTPEEITQKIEQLNTPDFHWKNPVANPQPNAQNQGSATKPFTAHVQFSNLNPHQAWAQPLEQSDHQDIISQWDGHSLQRGQKIYQQLCITCHGDETKEGSIPIALKFHRDPFKNGADPYRMFQTLTKGYATMMPMPQFSTRQKYDVIHYIREQFLAKHNPTQLTKLTKLTDTYLHKLPRGHSLIEEKETIESIPRYKQMDFGNVLFGTYQIEPGPINKDVNIAQKGIAIRLAPGPAPAAFPKATPGPSTITTPCALLPSTPATNSSTGKASTSTAPTAPTPPSSEKESSPTPTAPAGPTPKPAPGNPSVPKEKMAVSSAPYPRNG